MWIIMWVFIVLVACGLGMVMCIYQENHDVYVDKEES